MQMNYTSGSEYMFAVRSYEMNGVGCASCPHMCFVLVLLMNACQQHVQRSMLSLASEDVFLFCFLNITGENNSVAQQPKPPSADKWN